MSTINFPYGVYRRDKSNDTPKDSGHEWTVVTDRGYIVDATLAFPDNHDGWAKAHNIAEAMNRAHNEGAESVAAGIRDLLRIGQ